MSDNPLIKNELLTLGDHRIQNYSTIYDFLANFNVIGTIIGVAIGFAFQNIVKSLTRDIVIPIFEPLFGLYSLRDKPAKLGPFTFFPGNFLTEFVYFMITVFCIYLIIMKVFQSQVNQVIHKMKTPERDYKIQSTLLLKKIDNMNNNVYKLQKEDEQQVAVETDEEGNILSDSYEYAQAKASSGTKYAYSYATRPYSVETFQD